MILLDTHVLIWLAGDDAALGAEARTRIEQAGAEDGLATSTMALWEISLIHTRGRFPISGSLAGWIDQLIDRLGLHLFPINRDIAIDAGCLSSAIHGDPGDRMMIATARWRQSPLLTADRKILRYAKSGLLDAIDARL